VVTVLDTKIIFLFHKNKEFLNCFIDCGLFNKPCVVRKELKKERMKERI
jgi:hypothetical protein